MKYVYTVRGFLKAVRRNDGSNALYWRAGEYDPEGRVTKQTYGNNVATTLTLQCRHGSPGRHRGRG